LCDFIYAFTLQVNTLKRKDFANIICKKTLKVAKSKGEN